MAGGPLGVGARRGAVSARLYGAGSGVLTTRVPCRVSIWAIGAGGGGYRGDNTDSGGGGGGGALYAEFNLFPGQSAPYVVGTGGIGGVSIPDPNGRAGGDTTVARPDGVTFTAGGGGGGLTNAGGAGGRGQGGRRNYTGGAGGLPTGTASQGVGQPGENGGGAGGTAFDQSTWISAGGGGAASPIGPDEFLTGIIAAGAGGNGYPGNNVLATAGSPFGGGGGASSGSGGARPGADGCLFVVMTPLV